MNRRDFVTSMLGASAGALVLSKLPAIAHELPLGTISDAAHAQWQPTYRAVLEYAWGEFQRAFGPALVSPGESLKIGNLRDGVLFTDQCSIGGATTFFRDKGGVSAVMAELAAYARGKGVRVLGPLALPAHVEFAGIVGHALRMVVSYDIMTDEMVTRFDVLGAA